VEKTLAEGEVKLIDEVGCGFVEEKAIGDEYAKGEDVFKFRDWSANLEIKFNGEVRNA
jgi:hypothetical protein